MKKGLIIGKFMPLHNGHINLIDFGLRQCDLLVVALVVKSTDTIPLEVRLEWLNWLKSTRPQIEIVVVDEALPRTEKLEEETAKIWTDYFVSKFEDIDIIFSSEYYGDLLADAMSAEHVYFDLHRVNTNISGREIRRYPSRYLEFLPDIVKNYMRMHREN